MRDTQKNKVYMFEDQIIDQFDKEQISVPNAKNFIEFIWANEGRRFPPKIKVNKRFKRILACANRETITLSKDRMQRWVLIHELTHSILDEKNDEGEPIRTIEAHGKEFVAKYFFLLDKYLKMPSIMLMAMAQKHNVKWK